MVKNVFVTGANGLIGNSIVKYLIKNKAYNVTGIDRASSNHKNNKYFKSLSLDLISENA